MKILYKHLFLKRKKIPHWFAGIAVFWVVMLITATPLPAVENNSAEEKQENIPSETAFTLMEIYTLSNTLPKELIDLQNKIDGIGDVEAFLSRVPEIEEQIEKLEWESTMVGSNVSPSFHQLSSLESRLAKVKSRLNLLNGPVEKNMQSLERWYKEWIEKENTLTQLKNTATENKLPVDSRNTLKELEEIISKAKILIVEQMRPTLKAGYAIGRIQTRVYSLNDKVGDLIRDSNAFDVQQTSPSMLTEDYYKKFDKRLLENGWEDIRLFVGYQMQYIQQNIVPLFFCLALLVLLMLLIHFSKSLVKASSRWYSFADSPFPTALFIISATINLINVLPFQFDLPPQWDTLISLPMILAVAMLTDTVCRTPWQSRLLRRIALFFIFIQLIIVIDLPQLLFYMLVFYISLVAFIFYLFLFIRRWKMPTTRKLTWAVWLWGVVPLLIILSGITGHDQLAVLILGMVLSIIVVTLMTWIMLLMLAGVLEMILLNFPMVIVRNNATVIAKQVFPALLLGHVLFWLLITTVIFRIYSTVQDAFVAFSSARINLFSLSFTPVSLLTIIVVCYLTVLCSRSLRAFLQQDVLPRYRVEVGVQVSITRLVHYAMLTIGFFILLKMLGFELNQITILGGALGVGIGFGLQAIVNNFVSGLILLFERPIKVGDIIETGEEVGRVKELGLRATIVETFDNAEIVIPNSELITGSVTNWTLAAKKARVKVTVGVAYGTDISNVIDILLSCADSNPMVLSDPKPQALFLAFGASSLDFELRVWIPDVTDRRIVLSELNQDIEAEFQTAGIEIPFPQSDLHLRSVHKDAAVSLGHDNDKKEKADHPLSEKSFRNKS